MQNWKKLSIGASDGQPLLFEQYKRLTATAVPSISSPFGIEKNYAKHFESEE